MKIWEIYFSRKTLAPWQRLNIKFFPPLSARLIYLFFRNLIGALFKLVFLAVLHSLVETSLRMISKVSALDTRLLFFYRNIFFLLDT